MYASKFGPVMEEMLTIRQRSGLQLKFIVFFLDDFDAFCAREYPEATLLYKGDCRNMDSQLRFSIPAPHGAAGLNNEAYRGIPAVTWLKRLCPELPD